MNERLSPSSSEQIDPTPDIEVLVQRARVNDEEATNTLTSYLQPTIHQYFT